MQLIWPYFISTAKNIDILKKIIKGKNYSKVIIFEIIIDKENSWNKFNIEKFSVYKEEEILIYPNF